MLQGSTFKGDVRDNLQGNKAFYANKTLFKSNVVSRKCKLKLYWSVIRQLYFMAVKHGFSKKVLYKNSLCLRGKY